MRHPNRRSLNSTHIHGTHVPVEKPSTIKPEVPKSELMDSACIAMRSVSTGCVDAYFF